MAAFMAKYIAKKFEEKNNLKCCKFLKEFTTLKVTILSRGKLHQLTYTFKAKFLFVNYNWSSKIFRNFSFVELGFVPSTIQKLSMAAGKIDFMMD